MIWTKVDSLLTHLPLDKMAAISQTTLSNALPGMKNFDFWLKFHWSLFLRVQLTLTQHWFRLWLGAESATSHYLSQCWPDSLMHRCDTRGRWVNHELCHSPDNICQDINHWNVFTDSLFKTEAISQGECFKSTHVKRHALSIKPIFSRNNTECLMMNAIYSWVCFL